MRVCTIIFVALAACAYASEIEDGAETSVYGMQGLKVFANTEEKLNFVLKYEEQAGFDFVRVPQARNLPVEVLVPADKLSQFKSDLTANDVEYHVYVEDVGAVIEESLASQKRASLLHMTRDVTFKSFPRYDNVVSYLKNLANTRSDIAKFFSMGKSSEGRDIVGIKISSGGENKPAIFVDAGIHAREWIAPTTALYAIKQLTENVTNSYLYKNVDIYIVPVLNPDGYEYTHRSASTRLWRKTRSTSSSRCTGVDANRNFGYKWMTGGASSNPCSDTYAGPKAFSEPETAALRDFILARKGNIKVYLTLHSYGNYLLHPWGYTSALPKNEPTLRCVAENAASALSKVRGTRYTIGSSTNVLYVAAGGSDDWAMAVGGADLSYTIELPSGYYGFVAPTSEIVPVGRETFEAFKVFPKYVEGKLCQNKSK